MASNINSNKTAKLEKKFCLLTPMPPIQSAAKIKSFDRGLRKKKKKVRVIDTSAT